MEMEKINDNTIRVLLENEDLTERDYCSRFAWQSK